MDKFMVGFLPQAKRWDLNKSLEKATALHYNRALLGG
jgi:hypothetical protein